MFSLIPSIETWSIGRSTVVLAAVLALATFDLSQRVRHRKTHYVFAALFGTILSVGLIKTSSVLLQPGLQDNPHIMALGILLVVLAWKALFGPWETQTKAAVLGTFLFWITFNILLHDAPEERNVRLVASGVALLPAIVWCILFLRYHQERLSSVVLMFFSGMLATVPILFYDTLVRRGVELQFFVFKLTPESFNSTSQNFIAGQTAGVGMQSALLASLLSFVIVGVIEETSKSWVVHKSGMRAFTSIDDALQLSIIVAIGFAFAENIVNPVYFTGFVREYLLDAKTRDVVAFITNVLGRSVLTSMVHIVSTGVMGYFLGLAVFAGPYLVDSRERGGMSFVAGTIHRLLRLPEESVFRTEMLIMGLGSAILLHSVFNFLVTLPDLLPSHPQTLGQLLGFGDGSMLGHVPLLLLPSLFYVVGGFWLLTELTLRKENMKERGVLLPTETFVAQVPIEA